MKLLSDRVGSVWLGENVGQELRADRAWHILRES